jgi:NADPH:quinone reductase-like Zn-dependent oxidoreductase
MKAHVYRQNGEPSQVLTFQDIAAPAQPGPNEVVVRITRRMVHPIDDVMMRGYIPAPIPPEGTVPGGDGVGVVEQVGSGVDGASGIKPGQRVMLFPVQGTWAERVVAPAMAVIPVPDDVNDTIACQIAINGITAIVLMRAALAASGGAPLLVTAASSSVGRNLIALAQMRGATAIALVRSDASAAILAPSVPGVSVVSSEHEGWAAKVTAAAGQAPAVAIDAIGGETSPQLLNLLADGGTLLTYGGMDARPSAISTISLTVRQQTLRGLNAYGWLASTPAQRAADIADLFELARRAPQNFAEYSEFPFNDAIKALSAAHATPRRGATILTSEA